MATFRVLDREEPRDTKMPEQLPPTSYCGRFAPSPTGPLHFGSLVAALASFLEARRQGGRWLLRIDDIDPPREQPGAADDIQRTLEAFRLEWDGPVLYQSRRRELHDQALTVLADRGMAFDCGCTRRDIAERARQGPNGLIYPGTCRNGLPPGREPRALRVPVDDVLISFEDALQGPQRCELAQAIGDFIVRRADGCIAYHLAAAVDDGDAVISHVVRGADLLWCTPPQLYLMQLLGLRPPHYMHLPVAVNAEGQKLSKQSHAAPLDARNASRSLHAALVFLRQQPPAELIAATPSTLLGWALEHWNPDALRGVQQLPGIGSITD